MKFKRIKVTEANAEKINQAIKAAEGRATARTITAADVMQAIQTIGKKLDIQKKSMVGIEARIDYHAQQFPRAYKWTPESTHFDLERGPAAWYITDVYRARCEQITYRLTLTDEARRMIISKHTYFN